MFRDWIYPLYIKAARPRPKRKRQASDKSRLIALATVICAALGLNTDSTLIYQLFSLLLCLLVSARFLLRFNQPHVLPTRHLPRYVTAHQPFQYRISLTNKGNNTEQDLRVIDLPQLTPPSRAQFHLAKEPGEETRNPYDQWMGYHRFRYLLKLNTGITIEPGIAPILPQASTLDLVMTATAMRRGWVNFSSIQIQHPDPFGLNHGIANFNHPEALLVMPKHYQISNTFLSACGMHFSTSGSIPAWTMGESDEFVSLRDYRAGDPTRKIHWPSSAKRNKLVVKEYQDERFLRQALILDTSGSDNICIEECISVAASFLLAMNKAKTHLNLITLSHQSELFVAGNGLNPLPRQLEALATLKPSTLPLTRLTKMVNQQIKMTNGFILILSEWQKEHHKILTKLTALNLPHQVFIIVDDIHQTERHRDQSNRGEITPSHSPPAYCHQLPMSNIQSLLVNQ
ncbi:MAG: DUF58 domain-containing protein [Pseudomonadales bacterium]|nr:DUF58 domain-containing protein [Pseudomonadales bacterium]